jgi:hypothetical protein
MNRTTQNLQAQYLNWFLLTVTCVFVAAVLVSLIWIGKTGGHLLAAAGVALVCGYVGFRGTVNLYRRRKQLLQMSVVQQHGPYGTTEYVAPHEAGRQLGNDNGPNMWSGS